MRVKAGNNEEVEFYSSLIIRVNQRSEFGGGVKD